jgi:hypothetical protein
MPHAVSITVSRGTEPPRLEYPPIQLYWFAGAAFMTGIEIQYIDNTPLQVYSTENWKFFYVETGKQVHGCWTAPESEPSVTISCIENCKPCVNGALFG